MLKKEEVKFEPKGEEAAETCFMVKFEEKHKNTHVEGG